MRSSSNETGARRGWTLGIDFGTSNTAAAHTGAVSDSIETIQLSHNRTTMASSVYVESPHQIDVGEVAFDKAQKNPSGFLMSPKRTITQGSAYVNGYDIPASVPVAAVLRSVVDRATKAHNGEPPSELVLTHPEAWTERETGALLAAAKQLGFAPTQVTTMSEPQAAAHYYTRAEKLEPGAKIGVFDFGGGTLDVAVLQANDRGSFDVIAANGDNQIGGKNFDSQIRRWVDAQLEEERPDVLQYLRTNASMDQLFDLDDSIRRAKELLSETQTATISVPTGAEPAKLQITRDELEEVIAPSLRAAFDLARATIASTGVTSPSDLVALYLTGGSSRIPAVHELLAQLGPIATLDDPKTVVAQGALTGTAPVIRGLGGGNAHGRQYYGAPNEATGRRSPGNVAEQSSTPKQSKGPGRRRLLTLGLPILGVVILVIAAIVVVPRMLDDGAGSDATSTSGEASASDSPEPLVDKREVIDALPSKLASDVEDCSLNGETTFGGREYLCQFADDAALVPAPVDNGMQEHFFNVGVDPDAAASDIVSIREGAFASDEPIDELVENSQRNSAARIYGGPDKRSGLLIIKYANTRTGVMITAHGFADVEEAKQFLITSGLST